MTNIKTTKRFITRDSEAGNIIDEFDTLEEARAAIERYEAEDKQNGDYAPDFYEVYDSEKGEIVNA